MGIFANIALDIVPACTWSLWMNLTPSLYSSSMKPDIYFSSIPPEWSGEIWGCSKSQPAWSFFLIEVTSTVAPHTLNQCTVGIYQQDSFHWIFWQIAEVDQGISLSKRIRCFVTNSFDARKLLNLGHLCNILVQFVATNSSESNDSHNVVIQFSFIPTSLMFPTISSLFLSNSLNTLTAEWKLFWIRHVFHKYLSLPSLCLHDFMKKIINSWEIE